MRHCQELTTPEESREIARQLTEVLVHLEGKGIIHGEVKLVNIVRTDTEIRDKSIKLFDAESMVKLDKTQFMGGKGFSTGVMPPEMFQILDGRGADKLNEYWSDELSKNTAVWRKVEPRWSKAGDAVVVKSW